MKSAVTVSLVPEARGGPFVFWDDLPAACRTAQELGFDAIELFAPGPDAVPAEEVKAILADTGLSLAAVGTGAGWVKHRLTLTSPDEAVRRRAVEFVRGMIEFGAANGAPVIIGSMQGRWGDGTDRGTALGYLADVLDDLGLHARMLGVPLIYEPLNRYETNMINRLEDGIALIERAGAGNVKLLADLFHMNMEEENLPAAIRAAAPHVGHVHLADSNRRPAGGGHTLFPPVAAALRDIPGELYVSAECFPHPDPDAAARATIFAFRQFFA
jgi:sugar phosphate isomerase/epimerase